MGSIRSWTTLLFHHVNMPMLFRSPPTQHIFSNTGGIYNVSYFCSKHRLWDSFELPH